MNNSLDTLKTKIADQAASSLIEASGVLVGDGWLKISSDDWDVPEIQDARRYLSARNLIKINSDQLVKFWQWPTL